MSEGTKVSLPGDLLSIPDPLGGAPVEPPPFSPPEGPSETRSARRRRARLLLTLALAWAGGIVLLLGIRGDVAMPHALAELGAVGLLLVLAAWVVTRPGRLGLGTTPPRLRGLLLGAPAAYLAVTLLHGADAPEPPGVIHLACLGLSSLMALGPFVALGLVRRHALLTATTLRGASLGLAAGLVGSFGIHVHCSLTQPLHTAVGHGAVLVLAAFAGAFVPWRAARGAPSGPGSREPA